MAYNSTDDNPNTGNPDRSNLTSEGITQVYHSRGQRRKYRNYQQSRKNMPLNLVAMIDVVFLLLMYFLLSANFTTGEEVYSLDLPASLSSAEPDPFDIPEQPLLIEIITNGPGVSDYYIEIDMQIAQPADFTGLYQFMDNARIRPGNPNGMLLSDTPILIQPAINTRWEHALNTFNSCLRAGYTNVSMIKPGNG